MCRAPGRGSQATGGEGRDEEAGDSGVAPPPPPPSPVVGAEPFPLPLLLFSLPSPRSSA